MKFSSTIDYFISGLFLKVKYSIFVIGFFK